MADQITVVNSAELKITVGQMVNQFCWLLAKWKLSNAAGEWLHYINLYRVSLLGPSEVAVLYM